MLDSAFGLLKEEMVLNVEDLLDSKPSLKPVFIYYGHRRAFLFAEIEIVDYRLSFADQGKQTTVFCFRL
jgi:hypothetical protein